MNNLNDDTNILLANECLGTDSLSGITNAGVARDAHLARMEHAISDFQSPEAFEAVHNNYDSIYPKMSKLGGQVRTLLFFFAEIFGRRFSFFLRSQKIFFLLLLMTSNAQNKKNDCEIADMR